MSAESKRHLAWKMPLVGALAGFVALLPSMIYGNDLGAFLATVGLWICIGWIVLFATAVNLRRHVASALTMLASFCVASSLLFKGSYHIYETGRWSVHRSVYKAEVFRTSQTSQLKHIEWDGWGFAGSDTVVYLVFDPDDRLTKKYEGESGPPPGIACKVWRIHRLERHWYAVTFYTNTSWDQCE